jgi:hypothetical protein
MRRILFPVCVALMLGACVDYNVPNYQAGSLTELTNDPSPTVVFTYAQGLPIGTRSVISGVVINWGEVGREGYSLDPANPGNNIQRLRLQDPSFGSGTWSTGYANIREINFLLKAVDQVVIPDAQKEGIRGWAKTLMAIEYLMIVNVFDDSGLVIDADRPVDAADLAPIVTKAEGFAHIIKLLDEGKAHLQRAGATFAFNPGPGFAGFNTPANFIKVNRALKARVDVYMRNWSAALASLGESFIDPAAAMSLGAYGAYSNLSGDAVNPLFDPLPRTQVAHQNVITDAQTRPDGTPDLRATTKTAVLPDVNGERITNSIKVFRKWDIYKTNGDPIPIIKNEELVLLRAEANFQLGNRAAAITDINVVRTRSGGLAPLAATDPRDLVTEILYNRRYSLMWEGAHRWIDMRRYGRLAQLPRYEANHVVYIRASLPQNECQPRELAGSRPAGCTVPAGV